MEEGNWSYVGEGGGCGRGGANSKAEVVTSFSVAVAVDKKTKILCGQLSDRCTTCRRFD